MNQTDLTNLVNNWCPKGPAFDAEDFEMRVMRALMAANACVLTHEAIAKGKQPLAPLSMYPKGFAGR